MMTEKSPDQVAQFTFLLFGRHPVEQLLLLNISQVFLISYHKLIFCFKNLFVITPFFKIFFHSYSNNFSKNIILYCGSFLFLLSTTVPVVKLNIFTDSGNIQEKPIDFLNLLVTRIK